jgi:hypothetical protein
MYRSIKEGVPINVLRKRGVKIYFAIYLDKIKKQSITKEITG